MSVGNRNAGAATVSRARMYVVLTKDAVKHLEERLQ